MKTKVIRIKLKDCSTKWGWDIRCMDDLILALSGLPYFKTVAACFIKEAVIDAARDRREYDNIYDLARHIAANYI